jgi:hypothetical protein
MNLSALPAALVAIGGGVVQIVFNQPLGRISVTSFNSVLGKREFRFERRLVSWMYVVTGMLFIGLGAFVLVRPG